MLKSLEKDPDQRFSGCGEFLQKIEEYEKERDAVHNEPQSLVKLVITGISVAVIGVGVYLFLLPPPDEGDADDEFIYSWIDSATNKVSIICREVQELKETQNYIKDTIEGAKLTETFRKDLENETGEITDEINKFKTKIKELENNI